MSDADKRAEHLMNSVMGCAFALSAEMSGLSADDLADPLVSIPLAADCVDFANRHQFDDHRSAWDKVLALGEKSEKAQRLAREIVDHPGAAWWFEDMNPRRQTWIQAFWQADKPDREPFGAPPNTAEWRRPANPSVNWERYAQKPGGHINMTTSTLYAPRLTSELMAYDGHAGDYECDFPLAWWTMRFADDVRIFEIHGPDDWHNLCVRCPARGTEDDRLVPNWSAAADDWDGVHLSFGGMLTAELGRFRSDKGWTMLESTHAELTYWLRPQKTEVERLPDYQQGTITRLENFNSRFPDITDRTGTPYTTLLKPSENAISLDDVMARFKALRRGGGA